MKYPSPTKQAFRRSVTRIPSYRALQDYEFALWEAGFNYAIRKTKQLVKQNKK